MKKYELTARQLRIILVVSIIAIIAIMTLVASFSYGELKRAAADVAHTTADASASQNNLQTLQQIQKKLEADKNVVERTNSIVAESKSYQYQDQIIKDLKDYASKANISITNFDFSSAAATTPTPGAPTPSTPAPAGVKSTSVSVTLKNPINYDDLLRFLKSVEQNLTKMQISKVGLAKSETGNDVSSEALTIEVYIR